MTLRDVVDLAVQAAPAIGAAAGSWFAANRAVRSAVRRISEQTVRDMVRPAALITPYVVSGEVSGG